MSVAFSLSNHSFDLCRWNDYNCLVYKLYKLNCFVCCLFVFLYLLYLSSLPFFFLNLWLLCNWLWTVKSSFIHSHALIIQDGPLASLLGVSRSHTYNYTHGRTPLDELSARRSDLCLHRTTHHINTRDKHPCPERDWNPRPQQPSGRRPTP
jgi:hypothetical protein